MPLQAHHERKLSPSGTPMRRFADFEPGDTFRYRGYEYMKSADGSGYCTEPLPVPPGAASVTLPPGQWLCEF